MTNTTLIQGCNYTFSVGYGDGLLKAVRCIWSHNTPKPTPLIVDVVRQRHLLFYKENVILSPWYNSLRFTKLKWNTFYKQMTKLSLPLVFIIMLGRCLSLEPGFVKKNGCIGHTVWCQSCLISFIYVCFSVSVSSDITVYFRTVFSVFQCAAVLYSVIPHLADIDVDWFRLLRVRMHWNSCNSRSK